MRALARNTDPSTSWTAAEAVEANGTAQYQREQVLEAVKNHPGKTSKELAYITGLDRYAVARRLPELAEVEKGEIRACMFSNRPSVTWVLRRDVLQ